MRHVHVKIELQSERLEKEKPSELEAVEYASCDVQSGPSGALKLFSNPGPWFKNTGGWLCEGHCYTQ